MRMVVLRVALDAKIGVNKCRIPPDLFVQYGNKADCEEAPIPDVIHELLLVPLNDASPSGASLLPNGSNVYLAKQMDGWVLNQGESLWIPMNGRLKRFSTDLQTRFGVVSRSTRVSIVGASDSTRVVQSNSAGSSIPTGFSRIGGLKYVIDELVRSVRKPLEQHDIYLKAGLSAPRGILLFGPPGTGKTLLMKALIEELPDLYIREASATELTGPDCDQRIHNLFLESRQRCADSLKKSVVIFIDEIDALCPSRDSAVGEQERRAVAALLTELDGIHSKSLDSCNLVVIGSTNRPHKIDIALRRPGRFEIELEVRPPDQAGRIDILRCLSVDRFRAVWKPSEEDLCKIAAFTHGFVGADLLALLSKSALKAVDEGSTDLRFEQILAELPNVKPSALREHAVSVPATRWDDIGGYEDVKAQLIETVIWPTMYADHFAEMNVDSPKGVLLFGPPGCSKTMMARAIATESRMNFVAVKGPEIFSKWVGESEQAIRDLFRVARQASPCVIFFDEIDAIATNRNSDDGGVSGRVLTQLLTEMDGINGVSQIIVVAATNRPQVLDSALLRPGRLDRLIYVGLPDEGARKCIWESVLSKIPNEVYGNERTERSDLELIIERTVGYSGAEIVMIAKEASILCIREVIAVESDEDITTKMGTLSIKAQPSEKDHKLLRYHHIITVIDNVPPRTDSALVSSLLAFKNRISLD